MIPGAMMSDVKAREHVVELVITTLVQVDPGLHGISEATCLTGTQAVVDSVGLVNFLVTLEQSLGSRIDLADLYAGQSGQADGDTPFATVGSLADSISRSLNL
jgi:acyl carrier protein